MKTDFSQAHNYSELHKLIIHHDKDFTLGEVLSAVERAKELKDLEYDKVLREYDKAWQRANNMVKTTYI